MTAHAELLPSPAQASPWGSTPGIVVGVVALSLIAVLLDLPLVAVALCMLVPLAAVICLYPHLIAPLVVFVLFSNAAVVAVRFHGVPSLAAALVPAALAVPLLRHLWCERQPLVVTASLPLAVLFVALQAVGLLWARYLPEGISHVKTSLTEGLALYFLVTNAVRTRRDLVLATWGLLLAGCFMGGLSLFQQVTGTFNHQYGGFAQVPGLGFNVYQDGVEVRQARLCGPIGEQNRYAQIMLMLVPLALCQWWTERPGQRKILAAVAVVLSAVGCVLAFSRGAAVGFAIVLVLMTVLGQLRVRQLVVMGFGCLLVLLAIPQYASRLTSVPSVFDLIRGRAASLTEIDGAIRGRATVMLAAARVAADYPLLGVGPGMFNFYSQQYGNEGGLRALEGNREAHSLYLELAAEHGLLGLTCFLVMTGLSLANLARMRRWWQGRDRRMEYLATGYLLAVSSYLATGLFLHFSYIRYFWLMLALADATSFVGRNEALRATAAARPGMEPPSQHLSGETE